jgi:hypothetical protein
MEPQWVVSKAIIWLQRIFQHLSSPFLGLLPAQRRPQDYAEINSRVECGVPRQKGQWGKLRGWSRHNRGVGMLSIMPRAA